MIEAQATPFEPIRTYDVPGIAIAQLLEGEASVRSYRDLVLGPNRLSPKQRNDLADMVKGGLGADIGPLSGVIDIVTNPMVWLFAVTSPAGPAVLSRGKSLFSVTKKRSAYQREHLGFLESLGLTSPIESYDGTVIPVVGHHIGKKRQQLEDWIQRAVGTEWDALLAREGLGKGLDPSAYKKGSVEARKAVEIRAALAARSMRADQAWTPETFEVVQTYQRRMAGSEVWEDVVDPDFPDDIRAAHRRGAGAHNPDGA